MISNERLEQLCSIENCHGTVGEVMSIAKELLELRRSLGEPYAYLCEWASGQQALYISEPGCASVDDWNSIPTVHHNTALYRKECS